MVKVIIVTILINLIELNFNLIIDYHSIHFIVIIKLMFISLLVIHSNIR